jgi:aspartyl/glutamyl-tRNA(Asn/Gln) amidotransferase C subunit
MQAVDTAGVEPMSHAQDLAQRLRPDAVTEPNRREAFQAWSKAPQAHEKEIALRAVSGPATVKVTPLNAEQNL